MKKLFLSAFIMALAFHVSFAQELNQRIPLIGSAAPTFTAKTTLGDLNFPTDYGSSWKILFSHPKDFTPVCSTELLDLAYKQEEFAELNTQLVVVSTDLLETHLAWKQALEELSAKNDMPVSIQFPLVEDKFYRIINSYGMLDSKTSVGQSIRGVFFIDPENNIRAFYFYPNEVGRNIDEIKRTLAALQVNYNNQRVVLPANWKPGEDRMISYMSEEDNEELLKPDSRLYQKSWYMTYVREE